MSSYLYEAPSARHLMVENQLRARGIVDPRVLAVMEQIPRELFVSAELAAAAYEDRALPSSQGQTISQPYIVAFMTEQLRVEPHHRILEIGTGTGYQTAILAMLCAHVYTVERLASLSDTAAQRVQKLGLSNVSYLVGDGSLGWPHNAPFDRTMVTAGAPAVPDTLIGQLAPDGRLIIPVGDNNNQVLLVVERRRGEVVEHRLLPCRFVKLVGEAGWSNEESNR